MRAIGIRAHGGLDRLEMLDLPVPEPGPGQVRVQVKACALNRLDVWVREGWAGLKLQWPHVFGADVAGVVHALGPGVEGVTEGTAVLVSPGLSCGRCPECLSGRDNYCRGYHILGEHVSGGYAEYLCVPRQNLLPLPERLSFEEAACVPLVFLTAWEMLARRAAVKTGDTVLVHAAGSGVGSAAIQIAKLLGARVLATAGSDEKLGRARDLGADALINYATQDFAAEARRLTDKRGVDVVVEHVGTATFEKSVASLAVGGRLVTCGATTGYDARIDLRVLFWKKISLLGSTMGSKGDLFQILRFVGEGRLQPVLDRVLPLAEARKAQELITDRAQFGKIVLVP